MSIVLFLSSIAGSYALGGAQFAHRIKFMICKIAPLAGLQLAQADGSMTQSLELFHSEIEMRTEAADYSITPFSE
jgi:hypothetical protein